MRNKLSISKNLCYLCGKMGADSKDHVPPKGMFDIENDTQRLTLPAHRECNSSFANDEEYFRDVIIQQAVALNNPYSEIVKHKIWRSWSKNGWNRYKTLIKTSKTIIIKSKSGLVVKKGLRIEPDEKILKRVAIKIARGIIYNDT
jgi:hypothetical protein